MRSWAALAALSPLLTGAAGSAQDQTTPIYLHVIPTEVADGARFASDLPLRVRVTTADPDALSRALRPSSVIARGRESLTVALPDSNTLPADAPPGPLAPTFLVDYEQAPVAALREALLEGSDARPDVAELVRFTAGAISNKTLSGGWHTASRVASERSGDCTEHAVLVAALARSFELPARIVLGAVILGSDDRWQAFGHAWTEIFDGKRWQLADAALVSEPGLLRYLPQGTLADEGPGYMLGLVEVLQHRSIRAVEVLGSDERG